MTPDRFWGRINRNDPEACWVWPGSRNRKGYGNVRHAASVWTAHRVAWTFAFGPIPEGLIVCHRCDNPPCVNPAHLFLGSYADNSQDMVRKGRAKQGRVWRYGEQNAASKLTQLDVDEIRRRVAAGETQRVVARDYDMSQTQISSIARRAAWR